MNEGKQVEMISKFWGSSLGMFVKGKQAVDLWELLWWDRTKENLDEPPRSSGL